SRRRRAPARWARPGSGWTLGAKGFTDATKRLLQRHGVLETPGRILLQDAREDRRDVGSDFRRHLEDRYRILVEHLVQDGVLRLGGERRTVRQELISHGADREQIRAPVEGPALNLLRRHVPRRADRPAADRDA